MQPPRDMVFPYTTLFRSCKQHKRNHPGGSAGNQPGWRVQSYCDSKCPGQISVSAKARSEEHTSELQSRFDFVCRLLLEEKSNKIRRKRGQGSDYNQVIAT